jgi:hypothetical protein
VSKNGEKCQKVVNHWTANKVHHLSHEFGSPTDQRHRKLASEALLWPCVKRKKMGVCQYLRRVLKRLSKLQKNNNRHIFNIVKKSHFREKITFSRISSGEKSEKWRSVATVRTRNDELHLFLLGLCALSTDVRQANLQQPSIYPYYSLKFFIQTRCETRNSCCIIHCFLLSA